MWLPKNRACLLSKWKWNPSFKIALSVSHIDKEIAHRLVHKNYQSTITRVTTNTSNYDLRRFGQNAIIRNKDTELHSCSKMLIGPFGWIRSSRTEFTFFCWSCHKDLTYSRSLNNDLGTKFTLLYAQKENVHSCIITKDEKKRVWKVRLFPRYFLRTYNEEFRCRLFTL